MSAFSFPSRSICRPSYQTVPGDKPLRCRTGIESKLYVLSGTISPRHGEGKRKLCPFGRAPPFGRWACTDLLPVSAANVPLQTTLAHDVQLLPPPKLVTTRCKQDHLSYATKINTARSELQEHHVLARHVWAWLLDLDRGTRPLQQTSNRTVNRSSPPRSRH